MQWRRSMRQSKLFLHGARRAGKGANDAALVRSAFAARRRSRRADFGRRQTLVEARGEVDYGVSFVEWFAEAPRVDGDVLQSPQSDKRRWR
jgi:hypothetical protein